MRAGAQGSPQLTGTACCLVAHSVGASHRICQMSLVVQKHKQKRDMDPCVQESHARLVVRTLLAIYCACCGKELVDRPKAGAQECAPPLQCQHSQILLFTAPVLRELLASASRTHRPPGRLQNVPHKSLTSAAGHVALAHSLTQCSPRPSLRYQAQKRRLVPPRYLCISCV